MCRADLAANRANWEPPSKSTLSSKLDYLSAIEVFQSVVEGYTHQDLAEMLGTCRETATQTLNEFKAMGLIETGCRRVEIKDPDGLAELAEF